MSLIHWWPLNGNITDNGADNFTLSATPSFSAAGKIGKCATNTNINAGQAYLSNQTLPLAKDSPISIFTWVYMNDYSTTGANLNGLVSNHNHGHNSDKGSGFGLNLRNNGNSFQVSISTSSTGGRTFSTYCGNTTFSAGEWHHVGFTYNGSRINFYLDGKYDGGLNFTSSYNSNNPIGIFCWSTGYSGYSSSCQLNDVRIYNHALSAKEVKEISKGLVLHYNFEDEYIEPTTNLIDDGSTFSSWSSYGFGSHGSKTILDGATPNGINKFCRVTDNYTNTYNAAIEMARWVTSTALTNGQQVAFSAYVRGINSTIGKNCFIHVYNSNGTDTISTTIKSITLTANWQRIEGVFTWNKTNTSSTSFSCYVVCEMMQGEQFDCCEPQFEAKDHNTAYVNGTRSVGKVYDNSGYGYNGTNNGIIISNDTISGKFSAQFAPDAYIEIPSLPQFNKVTYSMWVKIPTNAQAYRSIFIPKGDPVASGIWLSVNTEGANLWAYQGGNAPSYCKGTSTPLSADTWYLYTHTFDGTTGQNYLNGVAIGSAATYTTRTYIPRGVYTLGDSYTGTTWGGTPFDGKIADFKIYATVLSAEDILSEYNRKAAIDKNGNLFTGEIIETAGSATKIDKNSFIDSNLFATTMTLEDGSIWVPICVHYIPDGMFTGANQTFYYTGRNIWENFGAINDLERPESNQWEFYVMQQSTINGAFSKYRFKQNISPLSATWDQVNPSKVGTNVTRISGTSTNNYAGMYWYNTSYIAMCFANTSNGNWFGCGARAYWGDDYTPGYNGEQVRGWQLVYMRISKHKARMFKNGTMIPTDIIEN